MPLSNELDNGHPAVGASYAATSAVSYVVDEPARQAARRRPTGNGEQRVDELLIGGSAEVVSTNDEGTGRDHVIRLLALRYEILEVREEYYVAEQSLEG